MERNSISVGGLWTDERAQTAQDFAIGISIFLLVVGAVFVYFPTLFTPYGQAIQGEDTSAQAERVGMLIVDGGDGTKNLTEDDLENWIGESDARTGEELQEQAGLASTSQISVTITPLSPNWEDEDPYDSNDVTESDLRASGHAYQDQDASSVSRIVRFESGINRANYGLGDLEDEPAYRLTVRVW